MYLLLPAWIQAPTILYESDMIVVQGNSIRAVISPQSPNSAILGAIIREDIRNLIKKKYPEMADLLIDLNQCEAGGKHYNVWGDNKTSYGGFQFKEETFNNYCSGNWKSFEDQLDCVVSMIKMGLGDKTVGWERCWRIENLWKYF